MIVVAQRVSSVGDRGWQTNSRRRLGESLTAAAPYAFEPATPKPGEGGVIVTLETPG